MKINPIIPVWLMCIICLVLLLLKRKGAFAYIRQILIIVLLFVINLRIMVRDDSVKNVSIDVDVTFVIDNTISMLAEDYDGDERRIDAVKDDCLAIMKKLPGASFSVVSFEDAMNRLVPYTIDTNIIMQAIDTLNGQPSMYATGTSLDNIISKLDGFLESSRDTYKVIIFISDGESTAGDKLGSYPELADYVNDGLVLGYGTEKGGPMKAYAYTGAEDKEYIYEYDENYNRVNAKSKIDEDNLKSIASDLGVSYVHMSKPSSADDALDEIVKNINNSAYESDTEEEDGYKDIYYFFVIPLAALLVVDFVIYRRKVS